MKNLSWLGQVLIVTEQTTTKTDAEIQAACYQSSCLLAEVFGVSFGMFKWWFRTIELLENLFPIGPRDGLS